MDRAAQALGADIMGVFHSHTHTDAYPSPTDVAQALDPGWHYVLVSLRDTHPVVRSYPIVDGVITEEPVEVPGLGEEPGDEEPGDGGQRCGSPEWGSPDTPVRIRTRSVNNHLTCPRAPGDDQTRRPRGRRSPPTHRPAHPRRRGIRGDP